MSILKLSADTLKGTPGAGEIEYDGQFFATDTNSSRAQMQRFVRETAKSATGTSVDFTSIPAWARKITVMLQGVSTVGSGTTSGITIQIGTAGTPTTSGYATFSIGGQNVVTARQITNGFFATGTQAAAAGVNSGHVTLTNITGNAWVASGIVVDTTSAAAGQYTMSAGNITLGGTLNILRVTTQGGTDTFDAGTINIIYEG